MSATPPRSSVWLAFLPYVRPFWMPLTTALGLLLFSAAMELFKPWPLKFVIDHVLGRHGRALPFGLEALGSTERLLAASIAVVVVAIVGGIAEYHAQVRVARIGNTTASTIRGDVFEHLQRLSVGFHRTTGSGEMLTRLMKDVQDIKNVLGEVALETITQTIMLVGMAVVLIGMDPTLAFLSLAVFGPVAFCVRHYSGHIKEVTRRQRQKDSKAASIMTEAIAMLPAVQLFGQGRHASGQFSRASRKSLEAEVSAARMKGKLERWVEIIIAIGTGGVLWYGAAAVLGGRLTPGDLVVFVAYLRSTYRPTRRIASNWLQMSRASVSAERVVELLRTQPEIQDLPHATPAPPLRGDIAFDHVSFAYGAMPTLTDVHIAIPAGSLVAVVGQSGAGKSTLVHLLPRLLDPTSGTVRIDGRDIRDYTLASLRSQFAVVTQEAMLFGFSVRDNVAYGDPEPDEARMVAALKSAHLWSVIERLPDGLDTRLGERGARLSGGERQRLAIARAFYRDARIIILDEPTTGLDSIAETVVIESLDRLVRGRTTFVITHRLSTIVNANLVLCLEGGRVVESGTPAELHATGGRFEALLSTQSASLLAH